MDKIYYFVIHAERMINKWLKDAEDCSESILMDNVKKIL